MNNKLEKYNEETYELLCPSGYNIRDKFLREWKFYYVNYIPRVRLSFSEHNEREILFELELVDLVQFDFYFDCTGGEYIEDYILERLHNGEYYLSLDPYDARIGISAEDCLVIIAKELVLIGKG